MGKESAMTDLTLRHYVAILLVVAAIVIAGPSEMPGGKFTFGHVGGIIVCMALAGILWSQIDIKFFKWWDGWWHRMTRPITPHRTKINRP